MHATQGIVRFVVIKLGIFADRHPGRRRVTILTRRLQRTMWVLGGCSRGAERHVIRQECRQ
jgi:hypothetical protein